MRVFFWVLLVGIWSLGLVGCGGGDGCKPTEQTLCENGFTYQVDTCGKPMHIMDSCRCGCDADGLACLTPCDCVPSCLGMDCGDNGCGGQCGLCENPALPVCRNGLCVPEDPECVSDADCQTPDLPVCQNGVCVAQQPECVSDGDCQNPSFPVCQNGVCVAQQPECVSDGDCQNPSFPVCQNGVCVAQQPECVSDGDCQNPSFPVCQNGVCVAEQPECVSDGDCHNPDFPVCQNGVCVAEQPECVNDGDCWNPDLPVCENGVCVAEQPECVNDGDCWNPDLPVCQNGVCVAEQPECVNDWDCPGGDDVCFGGSCCTPQCVGLCCGDDSCGGTCPDTCGAGTTCSLVDCMCENEPSSGPSRYSHQELLSPISASVVSRLEEISALNAGLDDQLFMKVGASGTVSSFFLHCLAGSYVNLSGRADLVPTLQYFMAGDAAGTTPYERESLAAEVGRTAWWALDGTPSPVEQEAQALSPRFAFVNYGTNDMGWLGYNIDTLYWFYEHMGSLLDHLEGSGVIPLVTGLNPRSDSDEARRWVPMYNAVTRGMAEARQIPYLDLYSAVVNLFDMGLSGDGLHGNAYHNGTGYRPCDFTAVGLGYNYNNRNLLSLDLLDKVRRIFLDGEAAEPNSAPALSGQGISADPFVVDGLPFTHYYDTNLSAQSVMDGYPACDAGQDESGPEVVYQLTVSGSTPVRMVVLDLFGTDVDIHLLGADGSSGSCLDRNDKELALTLAPGTYHVVVDTWVSGTTGTPYPGAYLLALVPCDSDDGACL